jgi:hypothetical protein
VASAGTAGARAGVTAATGATTRQPPPPSTNPPPRGVAGGQSRTIQVAASAAWTATGVVLDPGVGVEIEASGTIEAAAPSEGRALYHQVPPSGRAEFHSHLPQAFLPALSLLGRIGNGPVVPVGLGVRMLAAPPYGSGELFLGINDDGVGDNSGAWTVRITILGGGSPPPRAAPPPLPPSPPSPPPPPPPVDTDREWTPWLNRDKPLDSADWEGLSEFAGAVPCQKPIAVECRTVDGRDWSQTGQRYTCSLEGANPGGLCINSENPGGCLDYEVRFRCP